MHTDGRMKKLRPSGYARTTRQRPRADGSARGGMGSAQGSGAFERPPLVLVVDDNPDNRELFRECLSASGYRIAEASDGQLALELAKRDVPDIIVMDLNMPIMDGYATTRSLKDDPRTKHIPVVVVTACGVSSHARAERAGCDAFLVKPCLPEDLEGVVRATLLLRRPALSAAASSA